LLYIPLQFSFSQDHIHSLSFTLSVSDELQSELKSEGRLFLYFDKNPGFEPRWNRPWRQRQWCLFGKNFTHWQPNDSITLSTTEDWDVYQPNIFLISDHPIKGWHIQEKWGIENIPEGTYYVQFVWDQNNEDSKINYSSGNLYSKPKKVEVNRSISTEISLSEIIPPRKLIEHELVKEVQFQSDTLSKWWGKTEILKASILLPSEYYKNPEREYPIRYDIGGYGDRYTRVNWYMDDEKFSEWWLSGEAPQVINVYLDGYGPYGDCYQINSEMGPYGYALIHELIPYIEETYRGTQSPETRFVSGCSTGGWSSLALQLFYPETFNGVFSYSPDPVDFSHFWLIDIYNDKNFYFSNQGYLQPCFRQLDGQMTESWKDWINWEQVLSPTGSYVGSRFFVGAYMGIYSPKGKDGQPLSLFDEETGNINRQVAEHWKQYDLLLYTKENWEELGPKLQGKIYIWMGDMDMCYVNVALRNFDEFLKSTENPKSDAVVEFTPMYGHCWEATQYNYILKAAERLAELDKE